MDVKPPDSRLTLPIGIQRLGKTLTALRATYAIREKVLSLAESQSAPRLVAHRRRDPNQSGYSSFRQVRGSAGWAFGVRSSRKL
jgi:hypothetical protein